MIHVLAYDIAADGRRARFFKRLKRLMVPVQESVFEGDLSGARLTELERHIGRELDLRADAVRLYPLCRSCRGLVRTYGVSPDLWDGHAPLIIGP